MIFSCAVQFFISICKIPDLSLPTCTLLEHISKSYSSLAIGLYVSKWTGYRYANKWIGYANKWRGYANKWIGYVNKL